MDISKEEYFFAEWLILGKDFTEEQYRNLTEDEIETLKKEYYIFESKLK